jgi:hypothetical protein
MTNPNMLYPDAFQEDGGLREYRGNTPQSIGPSDSSDSGSDLQGLDDPGLEDNSDRMGTGEHFTAGSDEDLREANDIAPDRIVGAEDAGLGGGLDQAEEALLGITDEELAGEDDDI